MADTSAGVAGLKVIKFFVWLVYALATAAIIVLSFGFVLLLFDANPANDFAALIAKWGTTFAKPFIGLVEPTPLGNGGVIAWSLLFAIAVYAILAWLVGMGLDSISRSIYQRRSTAAVPQQAAPVQPVAQTPQPAAPEAPAAPAAPPAAQSPAVPEPAASPTPEPPDAAQEPEVPAPAEAPAEAPEQPEPPSAD